MVNEQGNRSKASQGFLKVTGDNITLDGEPVVLKGAALGGWSESKAFTG
jgi:hypothetical protein